MHPVPKPQPHTQHQHQHQPSISRSLATRVELSTFWFGPTPSGRVAIAACAIIGGDARWDGSFGAELAAEALRSHRHWFDAIGCRHDRPAENAPWARLVHRSLSVDGREAFHLSYGFMHRLQEAAALRGLACCPCPPHWAALQARLDPASWPDCEAKALLCKAELEWEVNIPDALCEALLDSSNAPTRL